MIGNFILESLSRVEAFFFMYNFKYKVFFTKISLFIQKPPTNLTFLMRFYYYYFFVCVGVSLLRALNLKKSFLLLYCVNILTYKHTAQFQFLVCRLLPYFRLRQQYQNLHIYRSLEHPHNKHLVNNSQ